MIRIVSIVFLLASLIGVGVYAGGLQSDVDAAVTANQTYVEAMHAMAKEQVKLNQQIIERDHTQRSIQRNLAETQQRLRDAGDSPKITHVQRECLDSGIPDSYLDVLRSPAGGHDNKPSGEVMPGSDLLRGRASADVPRQHVGRAGVVCRGSESGLTYVARGQKSNSGILQ